MIIGPESGVFTEPDVRRHWAILNSENGSKTRAGGEAGLVSFARLMLTPEDSS